MIALALVLITLTLALLCKPPQGLSPGTVNVDSELVVLVDLFRKAEIWPVVVQLDRELWQS